MCAFACASGEAYDKVARLLGLELRPSGGAAVETLAAEGDDQRFKFSLPLRMRPNCNFSYAGLKTAVRLAIEAEAPGPATDANRQVNADCILLGLLMPAWCLMDHDWTVLIQAACRHAMRSPCMGAIRTGEGCDQQWIGELRNY